ncbi:hypothetical protein PCL_06765 [Purpureocillium lilacinum]|uniref:SMP-30/Gluconolactonase/LRE-like region domain-containing protein n=2 Tax=Purpureocillium lilacinum TaxID=33203 RepID=A0A2U3DU94_PURLI|nr:hypothetical protein Purlil1_359 [Purpureocillium lilacinum]PWI65794.1 hypothetical protein PCL_06765 [Purpureocillium lilacinum]
MGSLASIAPIEGSLPSVAANMTNLSHFVDVNVAALATDAGYFAKLPATNIIEPAISLLAYHDDFYRVLGRDAKARKVWDLPWEAFHEAGIYNKRDNSLYVTSNFQSLKDNINITVVSLDSDDYPFYSTQFPDLAEANGGTNYYPPGAKRNQTPPMQLYCDEGDFERPSQLLAVDPNTNKSTPVLTNFLGRNFSSLNDVRQHPVTGDLWFTDADYGYFQHFRAEPTQPKQVYRFEPDTGAIQVVADGFVQPNGLEFSPDLKTLYVSDTGSQQFKTVPTGPSSIYAFDVIDKKRLANRRTFAWADTGFPDGVHCDTKGNVWASCGDGVHIWNKKGEFLGKIFVGEMSNNFAFAPGKVFVFSNARLWVVENVKAQGREVCQDFGVGCDK